MAKPHRPLALTICDGKVAVSLDAIAHARVIDAERDPEAARALLADIGQRITGDLPEPYQQWLSARLADVASGADANIALRVRRRRGDRSLPMPEVRARLRLMAAVMVVMGKSRTAAADDCAGDYRDESAWRKLPRQYPEEWEAALVHARAEWERMTGKR